MTELSARISPGPRVPKGVTAAVLVSNRESIMTLLKRWYGDAFFIHLPTLGPSVVVSSPELVKQMFTASPDVLSFGDSSPLGAVLGPGSLFSLDGQEHLRERRLLLPPFHGDRMKSYEGIIEEEALREMATWPAGEDFKTLPAFMRITLNSILRAVFGAEGPHLRQLADLVPGAVRLGSRLALVPRMQRNLGRLSPGGKLARLRWAYDRVIDEMIDETLADENLEERADVMALLLRANYDDGSAMSRSAIADELLTLLAAGHETTATSLAWGVERLRRHPWILSRLREEAAGDGNRLRVATINEIQRTRPVIIGIGRHVKADHFELGEWRIPKGHRVVAWATMIHHDERFFERPKQFEPDRFVGRKPDTYTWIPFGGGGRRCIGAAFAQMEMDIVLRTLLRQFELLTTTDPAARWRSRGIAFAPADGGLARVRRSSAAEPSEVKPRDATLSAVA
jgi:cytochrome P450 family 138